MIPLWMSRFSNCPDPGRIAEHSTATARLPFVSSIVPGSIVDSGCCGHRCRESTLGKTGENSVIAQNPRTAILNSNVPSGEHRIRRFVEGNPVNDGFVFWIRAI